ncbi:MAG TPA: sulfurase [Paracoccaceae bacterium]
MPALLPTRFAGTITWLGIVPDREAALEAQAVPGLMARFDGPEGEEAHGGLTRPSCSRVQAQYPLGTPIRNTRQFSILAAEELALIAAAMGIEALDPALLGATMVIAGIPDFTLIPPSSRLQAEGGATLVVDLENRPCQLPARPIENQHPGMGRGFKPAALGRRGVTAWVEAEGLLQLGQTITLHIPDQPAWPHLDSARAV